MSDNTKNNNNIKKLFSFTVNKEIEVEKIEESTNEAGEVTKTIKKVKENTPVSFYLRQPNRKIREEAEFYYYSCLSNAIKKDVLPIILLEKHISNDRGSLSDGELKTIGSWRDKNLEFQRLGAKPEKDRTDEDKKGLDRVTKEIAEDWEKVKVIQSNKGSIFSYSAENFSQNKLIFWYTLFLGYTNDNKPYFEGESFDDKLVSYDKFEDQEDVFVSTVVSKFLLFTSLWMGLKDSVSTAEFQKEANKIEIEWNAPKKDEQEDIKVEEAKTDKSVIVEDNKVKQ